MRRSLPFLALLLASAPLRAEPGLPDAASVNGALDAHPSVLAAQARVEAARADARARARGTQELTFSGSYTRRSVDREGSFDEYDTQLSRPIRLPGKGRLDRQVGQFGIEEAENLAEDAKHQAALLLAGHWFDWLGAAAEAEVDRQAVANLERTLAAVRRRVELLDAAQLEADQAAAALGTARVAEAESAGRAATARGRLVAHFPALALPQQAPPVPAPDLPAGGLMSYRDRVLANSHEIAAAQAAAQRMQALAARARMDRMADPSIGVRLFSERDGAERGAGLVFSMPLGGGHRAAVADQAAAEANSALAEAALARANVLEVADADLAEAQFRHDAWRLARAALDAQMAALVKLRRGQALGEIDLADVLLGERSVHDSFRAEAAARTAALRAITRIRIDSHALWLADDPAEGAMGALGSATPYGPPLAAAGK
ncbi:MAG: TolC family protein [Croceibacterium sp.]